jgi:hypothetical protein
MNEIELKNQVDILIKQLRVLEDGHVALDVKCNKSDSDGRIYLEFGKYGNVDVNTYHEASLVLGGVLMGMNINRG